MLKKLSKVEEVVNMQVVLFVVRFFLFCQVKRDCGGEFKKQGIPLPDCSWIYPDETHPTGLCQLKKFPTSWPSKIVASKGKNPYNVNKK